MTPLGNSGCGGVTGLKHERFEPALEEMGGGGQPLRTSTNDNDRIHCDLHVLKSFDMRQDDHAAHIDKCQCVGQNGAMSSLPVTIDTTAGSCCASGQAMDEGTAQDLAKVFKALGDPTRVKLLSMIVASTNGEMCVCDLTEPVGLSQPTVSHHMKLLVEAGLVTREQRGKWAFYQPTTSTLAEAVSALLG